MVKGPRLHSHGETWGVADSLFVFGWELRAIPGVPTALEGIQILKAFIEERACRTGTGFLFGSSAIENEGFIFFVFVG
jgi:hypothetical protein